MAIIFVLGVVLMFAMVAWTLAVLLRIVRPNVFFYAFGAMASLPAGFFSLFGFLASFEPTAHRLLWRGFYASMGAIIFITFIVCASALVKRAWKTFGVQKQEGDTETRGIES